MNLAVVLRATWAVAKVLKDRGLHGRMSWSAGTPGTDPMSSRLPPPKCLPPKAFR